MRESPAVAQARAVRSWDCFAPAVLASGGDPAQEDAVLRRPGVALAHAEYLASVREQRETGERQAARARLEVLVQSDLLAAAWARAA